MKRFQKIVIGLAALLCVGSGAAILYAPYLPRLVQEGYPQLVWPAPGSFATVGRLTAGNHLNDIQANQNTQKDLNNWSRALFREKGGKALLVYQGGHLVVEHYADGFNAQSRFNSYSMVKSLVGALMLKALAERKIASLNDPVGHYLPKLMGAQIRKVPLKDFLGMRSGIMFEPEDGKAAFGARTKDMQKTQLNPFGPMVRLHMEGVDEIMGGLRSQKVLQGRYNYQNVNTALLGRVLVKVYGRPLEEILNEKIWQPAQAIAANWRQYGAKKPVTAYCCLYARPRDWVRVGRFLMTNGKGTGAPFLPEKLWRLYMGTDISATRFRNGRSKYGAHIYHNVLDRKGQSLQGKFTYMLGSRGQVVYMMPQKKLVVVRFGEKIQLLHSTLYAAWGMVQKDLSAK